MLELDAVVVGAGQSGLGVSYFLQRNGRSHVVLEKGRIGESWVSGRWDSFKINTPNFTNTLPGLPYDGLEPDGFWSRDEYVDYLRGYADRWNLPVREGTTVVAVEQAADGKRFVVRTESGGQAEEAVTARSVVVASGGQRVPRVPEVASRLPHAITQMHAAGYRNPASLPPGAVLVVGSAQSGGQIAEDLLSAGRTVYLSTGKVGRVPRRYRGRDLSEWWIESKFLETTYASLEDKSMANVTHPQVSGVGRYGHTISLQDLARQGAVILGHLMDVDGASVALGDDAAAHVHFADEFSQRVKDGVDAYLARTGRPYPPLEDDPADAPDPQAACASPLRSLNLTDARISTVIWATGFGGEFNWIRLPVLDARGQPLHQEGVSPVTGLYFMGLLWMRKRKSHFIYGVPEDSEFIAEQVEKQLS